MKQGSIRWRLLVRSWIRSRVVLRFVALLLGLCALVFPRIATADEPPTFDQLVQQGDRARFAGNTSDAINAYRQALKVRNDPRIVGRIGLVALDGGATAESMSYLLRAIIDSGSIPLPELQRIQFAFIRTRPLVTRVDIDVSHLGADVFIDGEPERIGTTAGEFYVFTLPGKHEVKATLAGYNDATVSIDAPKGGTIRVKLVLTPIPTDEPKVEAIETKAESQPCEVCKPASPAPIPPARTMPNQRADKFKPGQWVPGIGFTAQYGAVSPYPAAGFILSSHWKLDPFVSFGFDFRAAFSPREIEGYAIRGSAFTFLPNVCATREWFTGCLAVHTGIFWHSSLAPNVSIVRPSAGGGASFAAKLGRYKSIQFHVKLNGELLLDEYPIRFGGPFAKDLWIGPQFLTGVSIMASWRGTK
jgi:hypothetical protein